MNRVCYFAAFFIAAAVGCYGCSQPESALTESSDNVGQANDDRYDQNAAEESQDSSAIGASKPDANQSTRSDSSNEKSERPSDRDSIPDDDIASDGNLPPNDVDEREATDRLENREPDPDDSEVANEVEQARRANLTRQTKQTKRPKSSPGGLVAAFPDSPAGNEATVGLGKGDLVPEISGNDLGGTAFRLSDYQGKVIMLDFWGDW